MGMFDWLSPTAGADQGGMGLMGMLANPQTAGLLGMAGGLLQASGPSRLPVSNGMALGSGFQGMQQGIGNAIQNQRGLMMMRALSNATNDGGMQPAPQAQPLPAVTGGANSGPMSGLSAGMGNAAPLPQAAASSAQGAYPAPDPQSLLAHYYNKLNAYSLAGLPTTGIEAEMKFDPRLAMAMPTDAMKMAAAAYGYGSPQYQQALMNQVENAGAMSIRPGGGIARGNQISMIPQPVPGFVAVQDPNNPSGWTQVPVGGGLNAISSSTGAAAGATARAKAENDNQQVWDPTANNGAGGFVYQTRAQVNDASNGSLAPVGIRNNNFGNIKGTNGQFQR